MFYTLRDILYRLQQKLSSQTNTQRVIVTQVEVDSCHWYKVSETEQPMFFSCAQKQTVFF